MRIRPAGIVMAALAVASSGMQADERIANAHGDCAMPMTGFFRMADLAKNGHITRAEWMKMFNLIDQNHDGVLDAGEIAAFEQNGMMMTQQMMLRDSQHRPASLRQTP